jgi:uncharacterized protein YkwD
LAVGISALAVACLVAVDVPTADAAVPISTTVGPCANDQSAILVRVNQERVKRRLPPLALSSRLSSAAQNHSNWMARTPRFSHDGWVQRIRATGYPAGTWGQNIALGQVNADLAMSAWMSSAGHKSNLLSRTFKKLGVGCTRRGTTGNGYYWTQNFGS